MPIKGEGYCPKCRKEVQTDKGGICPECGTNIAALSERKKPRLIPNGTLPFALFLLFLTALALPIEVSAQTSTREVRMEFPNVACRLTGCNRAEISISLQVPFYSIVVAGATPVVVEGEICLASQTTLRDSWAMGNWRLQEIPITVFHFSDDQCELPPVGISSAMLQARPEIPHSVVFDRCRMRRFDGASENCGAMVSPYRALEGGGAIKVSLPRPRTISHTIQVVNATNYHAVVAMTEFDSDSLFSGMVWVKRLRGIEGNPRFEGVTSFVGSFGEVVGYATYSVSVRHDPNGPTASQVIILPGDIRSSR